LRVERVPVAGHSSAHAAERRRPDRPGLDDRLGRSIPRSGEALRLLTGYVKLLRTEASLASPELQRLAVAHVYDLIAAVVGATRDGAELAAGRGAARGAAPSRQGRHRRTSFPPRPLARRGRRTA